MDFADNFTREIMFKAGLQRSRNTSKLDISYRIGSHFGVLPGRG
jgi:hypothetical protein